MHIGAIDESATMGRSWIHSASPISKLLAFVLLLAAAMVSWNVLVLLSVVLLLGAALVSSGSKPRLAFGLAAYPAVFAIVFAVASAPDILTGAAIVAKAFAAGLSAVTIVLTTPYPQVFAPIQRVVPTIVGDALLMTYRSTFLLLDKLSNLMRSVRLRSGLSAGQPVRAARASAQALGGLLLYSFDLSQRDFDVMRVRGYQDRLQASLPRSTNRHADALMLAAAAAMLATSVLWRVGSESLNPFSWLLPPVPALLLALALALRYRSHS